MSEGTAVPYVRRWAMTRLALLTLPGEDLEGVRIQYSPVTNFDQALGTNGSIELVYWERSRSTVVPRAFKGTTMIKYREDATSDLIIVVAARDVDDTLEHVEQRAAEILGSVVQVFQGDQPASPGTHLTNISTFVASWESDPGILSSATTPVHASTWRVEINIASSVEQQP